jgi:hypothetical protein
LPTYLPYTLVSSTNKTDHHFITEIFLKVQLNTITLIPNPCVKLYDNPYYCNLMLVLVLADTDKDLPEVGIVINTHTISIYLVNLEKKNCYKPI